MEALIKISAVAVGGAFGAVARHLMVEEANAAVRGALAAGAVRVVVNDSHWHCRNIAPEALHPAAELAVVRRPDALWCCGYYAITFGGFVGLASALGMVLYDQYGVARVTAGDLTALCVFAGSFMRPVGGALADRYGGVRMLAACYAAVAALLLGVSSFPPLEVATASAEGPLPAAIRPTTAARPPYSDVDRCPTPRRFPVTTDHADTVDQMLIDRLDRAEDLPEVGANLLYAALLGPDEFAEVLGGAAPSRPEPPPPDVPEKTGTVRGTSRYFSPNGPSSWSVSSVDRIMARSMMFSSSRTFPGQS